MAQEVKTRQGIVKLGGYLSDDQTRCIHYHSRLDIIAIKFKCCGIYYPCYECHEALSGHEAETWAGSDYDQLAVLCGACKNQLTIRQYLDCKSQCPYCSAPFNPNCSRHYHLYFGG